MAVSGSNRQTDNNISDKIIQKVSIFPNMPQAGIKLRALLAEKDVSDDLLARSVDRAIDADVAQPLRDQQPESRRR